MAAMNNLAALLAIAAGVAACPAARHDPVRVPRAFELRDDGNPGARAALASCPPTAADPKNARCQWRRAEVDFSLGAQQPPVPVCLCDECADAADCRARSGGRCVAAEAFRARTLETIQVCVYPNDPCHAPCGEERRCVWSSEQERTACAVIPAPLPYQ
jgi:hypothetical protein